MGAELWHIKGEEAGGCNCAWGCPCQFNALPTHGRCEGLMTARITEGYFAPNRPAPLVLPIKIEADRERRTAQLSLPEVVEYRAEPIKDPVTGEEHRAQIRLPNGFEYREAEMGNTAWLKVKAGPIAFEHRNTYAQFNAFDWSNEGG